MRILEVWYPDWPVVAAGIPAAVPAAVVVANRVVAASPVARAEGVRDGLRRREAQGRCPEVEIVVADPVRDARLWEPVVAAVEAYAPGVEISVPGALALGTWGPSRYFGGDQALAALVAAAVDAAVVGVAAGHPGCRVGVADGGFAAALAARRGSDPPVLVVPPGHTPVWLAPQPVAALSGTGLKGGPELVDLLVRLGIRTLGQLAALPAEAVLARFGREGSEAHRLARGLDERPVSARVPPPVLAVTAELDPPVDQVDRAAFVARALADQLHTALASQGLACTRVAIEAETEHGEHLVRRWRHDGTLDAAAVAERVRWQLDAWLQASGVATAGLTLLRLTPDEVRPDHGRQLGFWGSEAAVDARMARSLARVQGLLGPEAVVTAALGGGRDPAERVQLIPWGNPRMARHPTSPPWPGCLPGPSPAVVHPTPRPAQVRDAAGRAVGVSGRGAVSAPPAELAMGEGPWSAVTAWAGPWPVDARWWDPAARRRARFQMCVEGGAAYLVVREDGQWWVEATYD